MRDEYIVGLDIGTTKICIAVGKKDDHGNIKIISFGNFELDTSLNINSFVKFQH